MGVREDIVEEEVHKICRDCFSNGKFSEGRVKLYKLYLRDYDKLNNMGTKYNLLYRLLYAEQMEKVKNPSAISKFVQQLKNDMDNTLNYKDNFTGNYCNMLSFYCDCEEIILEKGERLKYYNFIYEYYKDSYKFNSSIDTYIRMMISKFNIGRFQSNFPLVLEIIKDVHNVEDPKAKSTITQMLCDVKNMDKQLYIQALLIMNTSNVVGL